MKKLLVTLPTSKMREIYQIQKSKAPESLTAQFTDRLSRDDAIKQQKEKRKISVELFPSGKFAYQLIRLLKVKKPQLILMLISKSCIYHSSRSGF